MFEVIKSRIINKLRQHINEKCCAENQSDEFEIARLFFLHHPCISILASISMLDCAQSISEGKWMQFTKTSLHHFV